MHAAGRVESVSTELVRRSLSEFGVAGRMRLGRHSAEQFGEAAHILATLAEMPERVSPDRARPRGHREPRFGLDTVLSPSAPSTRPVTSPVSSRPGPRRRSQGPGRSWVHWSATP